MQIKWLADLPENERNFIKALDNLWIAIDEVSAAYNNRRESLKKISRMEIVIRLEPNEKP